VREDERGGGFWVKHVPGFIFIFYFFGFLFFLFVLGCLVRV